MEGVLKIEGIMEASSLSHVIGFFIAQNILMRGHVVPFKNTLVCIYGVQQRVQQLATGDWACVGHPSPRSPLVGSTCGPSENPISVCDYGHVSVSEHGERCLHS